MENCGGADKGGRSFLRGFLDVPVPIWPPKSNLRVPAGGLGNPLFTASS